LVKCTKCEFVYADLPDETIVRENSSYSENADYQYSIQQTSLDKLWFKSIALKLVNASGTNKGKILDIGCGNGVFLASFPQNWDKFGLDVSPWSKKGALQNRYHLIQKELENAELPDNHFDIITSFSTFEHIPQPKKHLKEILRILKPGGIVYIGAVPNYGTISVLLNLSSFARNVPPEHCNFFTKKTLSYLLAMSGVDAELKYKKIRTYGIPEIHRIYRYINQKTSKNNKLALKNNGPCTAGQTKTRLGLSWLLSVYDALPFPFFTGDKLELLAMKKDNK
jgi:ubiquinone/menaquinone biosynthesis C-methylase UbiE